jgi:PAS domain S-box-containing protein
MNKSILYLIILFSLLIIEKIKPQAIKEDSLNNALKSSNLIGADNANLLSKTDFMFYSHDKDKTLEYAKKAFIVAFRENVELSKAKQKTVNSLLIFGFVLMVFIMFFLYQLHCVKRKANIFLTKQKQEIDELNTEYQTVNGELKQLNEQLYAAKDLVEASEEKLRLLIKNSNDIFVLVNEKGEQFFISDIAKTLTGYEVEELLGNVEDVIYPDDIEIVEKHWERVFANKNKTDIIQYRHKHKEKGYVWFEAAAQNYLDNPAINAIVANIRDITERKKVEERLRASEVTKNRLFKHERNRIFDELVSNQKALAASTLKLIQNSERDTNTIKQLTEIEKNTNQEGKKIINKLISEYKHASFNSNWNEFEILFEKVHYFFYEKLNAKFPDLTANERKMCAFLKLNMSSKDISQITFQSEDALKKARLRLRQKLGITREINLVAFLQNI